MAVTTEQFASYLGVILGGATLVAAVIGTFKAAEALNYQKAAEKSRAIRPIRFDNAETLIRDIQENEGLIVSVSEIVWPVYFGQNVVQKDGLSFHREVYWEGANPPSGSTITAVAVRNIAQERVELINGERYFKLESGPEPIFAIKFSTSFTGQEPAKFDSNGFYSVTGHFEVGRIISQSKSGLSVELTPVTPPRAALGNAREITE